MIRGLRGEEAPADPTDSAGALARRDGWSNVLTMLGTSRDKRTGAAITATRLSWKNCEKLYRGNDMAAKIADEPAREITRRWLDVQIEGDKEAAEAVEAALNELHAQDRFRDTSPSPGPSAAPAW